MRMVYDVTLSSAAVSNESLAIMSRVYTNRVLDPNDPLCGSNRFLNLSGIASYCSIYKNITYLY